MLLCRSAVLADPPSMHDISIMTLMMLPELKLPLTPFTRPRVGIRRGQWRQSDIVDQAVDKREARQ